MTARTSNNNDQHQRWRPVRRLLFRDKFCGLRKDFISQSCPHSKFSRVGRVSSLVQCKLLVVWGREEVQFHFVCGFCVFFGLELGKYFKFIFMGPRATCFAGALRGRQCVCEQCLQTFCYKIESDAKHFENNPKEIIAIALGIIRNRKSKPNKWTNWAVGNTAFITSKASFSKACKRAYRGASFYMKLLAFIHAMYSCQIGALWWQMNVANNVIEIWGSNISVYLFNFLIQRM